MSIERHDDCYIPTFGLIDAMTEPYQNLADAIILQAVKDYRYALKKLNKQPKHKNAQSLKNDLEMFFRSDWYRELTSVDGETLIKKIQAEVSE
jgi:hypothetical protein